MRIRDSILRPPRAHDTNQPVWQPPADCRCPTCGLKACMHPRCWISAPDGPVAYTDGDLFGPNWTRRIMECEERR